jgi:hypothetical protein
MQRFYKFLIICLLMLCVNFTRAQMGKNIFTDSLITIKINALAPVYPPLFFSKTPSVTPDSLKKISIIPANYYTKLFGIICKKELQLQKSIAVPIFFRLGSLEYVNRLEGKR